MNKLKGLIFPGTKIGSSLAGKVSRLLDTVICYQIIEGDGDRGNGVPDGFQSYTPVPLGPEKDRFVRMVNDLKVNQAEYYGGLLSFISTASRYDVDETSVWSLVSRLHRGDGGDKGGKKLTDKVWQARLVLKLAEILDDEENEVGSALSEVSRKEKALFGALHGEIAGPEELLEEPAMDALPSGSGRHISDAVLLAAWGCLYVLDPEENNFLVTDSEECAGLLLDKWAEKAGGEPERLFEIGLPAGDNKKVAPGLDEARKDIRRLLSEAVAGEPAAGLREAGVAYQQILADSNVPTDISLEIFQLAGYPVKDVLAGIIGVQPVRTSNRCLIGILKSLIRQ